MLCMIIYYKVENIKSFDDVTKQLLPIKCLLDVA